MDIITGVRDLIRANVNARLDKAENPDNLGKTNRL